jgi:hypothetical protein
MGLEITAAESPGAQAEYAPAQTAVFRALAQPLVKDLLSLSGTLYCGHYACEGAKNSANRI